MIDIILHVSVSFIIASMFSNLGFSVCLALLLGFGKEIFLDKDISFLDISANLLGVWLAIKFRG
jgi:hypothetical protein